MSNGRYVPAKGDLMAISFNPRSDHEQRGRRPALVISNDLFNLRTGLAIVCPVTNTDRGIPFHVPLPASASITGFVMVEQLKSIDYRARQARYVEPATRTTLEEVLSLLDACVY